MHKKRLSSGVLCFACLVFFIETVLATCDCNSNIFNKSSLNKAYSRFSCTKFEKEIGEAFHKDKFLFEQLFRLHVAKFSNINEAVVQFKTIKKNVYRSAILSENIALLSELVKEKGVKSIIVLTNSKIFDIAPWIDKERAIFATLGGVQFIHILDFSCDFDFNNVIEVEQARTKVVSIIRLIANADGNVLIHCLGGEHRTEVVFEIMQKCINKLDMNNIIQRYKCHTGWESATNKGNFRQNNIDFIRDFPCILINDI